MGDRDLRMITTDEKLAIVQHIMDQQKATAHQKELEDFEKSIRDKLSSLQDEKLVDATLQAVFADVQKPSAEEPAPAEPTP